MTPSISADLPAGNIIVKNIDGKDITLDNDDRDTAYEWFAKAYHQKTTQVATCYYIAKINLERGNLEKAKGFIDKCLEGNFSALATITRADAQKLKEEIEAAAK